MVVLGCDLFTARGYPNPINPVVRIEYNMPFRERLRIGIYDMRGARGVNPIPS